MSDRSACVRAAAALTVALAALAGCSKNIWITQLPPFYTPELKTIAVVPFRNRSTRRAAGQIVADKLAYRLAANGAYRVYNRNDLKTMLDEHDLRLALGADAPAASSAFKKRTNVQAILTGAVTTFSATSSRQRRRDPQYNYNKKGRRYLVGYRSYTFTRNEANVSVTASLIRVADGTTMHATGAPVSEQVFSQGESPKMDRYGCAELATDRVVVRLVGQFAPVRRRIRIDPRKALRTASELYDNKWTVTGKFAAADERMFVVVALPTSCDRNRFRLVIVRKGSRKQLAVSPFTWRRKHRSFGYRFSPKEIAAKGGGPGRYEVKFYSGPEPVMKREFTIE